MAKIYLATSWRNIHYPRVLTDLRIARHEVYDFRDPAGAFKWEQISHDMKTIIGYLEGINEPRCKEGFKRDKDAIDWCDTLVLLLPCGNSAHLEAGYAVGQGKRVIWYLKPNIDGTFEPELMYRFSDEFVTSTAQLLALLHSVQELRPGRTIAENLDIIGKDFKVDKGA